MTYATGRRTMGFVFPTASLDAISFFSLFFTSHQTLSAHPAGPQHIQRRRATKSSAMRRHGSSAAQSLGYSAYANPPR